MARESGPARHERPAIDEAALAAARAADRLLAGARALGATRWTTFMDGLPDRLSDAPVVDLRAVAVRARSAYGPKDSIREALPPELTEPLAGDLDRLIKLLAREQRGG